jgi:hypothetical protein
MTGSMTKRSVRLALVALLALGLAGCRGAAESPDELAARYQEAHEAGDLAALRGLVFWEGVDELTRSSVERQIEKELGRGIESVRVESLSEGFALEYTLDGVTYRPNLEPVRRLRIEFTQSEDSEAGEEGEAISSASISFLVGEREGAYLITASAPVTDGAG